jgi:hypothetical protein
MTEPKPVPAPPGLMRLPKNSHYPNYSETHPQDAWCASVGCTPVEPVPAESRPTEMDWAERAAEQIHLLYRDSNYFKSMPKEPLIHGWAEVMRTEFFKTPPVMFGFKTVEEWEKFTKFAASSALLPVPQTLEARRLGMEEAFDLCAVIADEGNEKADEHETGTGTIGLVGLGAKILASVIRSRKESLIAARMKELTSHEQQEETPHQSPASPSSKGQNAESQIGTESLTASSERTKDSSQALSGLAVGRQLEPPETELNYLRLKVLDADKVMAAIDHAVNTYHLDSRSEIADARQNYGEPYSSLGAASLPVGESTRNDVKVLQELVEDYQKAVDGSGQHHLIAPEQVADRFRALRGLLREALPYIESGVKREVESPGSHQEFKDEAIDLLRRCKSASSKVGLGESRDPLPYEEIERALSVEPLSD